MLTSTPDYSRIHLRGTLTHIEAQNDPRETNTQKQWVGFEVLIYRKWQKRTGETVERMQTVPCVVFGKMSTMIRQVEMLLPMKVVIEGSFTMRPLDGRLEVLVDKIYTDEVFEPLEMGGVIVDTPDTFIEEVP